MTRRVRLSFAMTLALGVLAGAAGRAGACSCMDLPPLMDEFDNAAVVFSGRVLEVHPSVLPYENLVILRPIERWKGGVEDPVQLITPENSAMCGVEFQVGEDYLVFASHVIRTIVTPREYAFTHLCTRTSPLVGNPFVPQLPAPVLPVPAQAPTWGALKSHYR